ncbi:glucose 1-dehydrogenase [Rhodococcus sp. TAF43]|uniref:SDR family NAD(P)-dependent oxidoreductase n=1 Tax=unclassified Rhodococcus (in: high G+C Gram-positive bacteria) TaxID=192944 RepID=UPI001582AFD3|nr:glucose 1-dehydrogenase [Rhodococcus sp. W8901]QKT13572.1 glucose 1-dehydrogenase [Rhodococcus sp. W8901]
MARLDGKIAIITGAAQGMGAATARLFVAEGARVALGDVLEDKGRALAEELGDATFFAPLDVSSEASWTAFADQTVERFGGLDILVNNAGVMHWSPIEDIDVAKTERLLDINVLGNLLGAKTVVPTMKRAGRGVIVNISSVDGLRGVNGLAAYTASKWAVRGLTKALAYELGPAGIRVCSVHPGGVDTTLGNPGGLRGDDLQSKYTGVPLQRIGESEDIARATLFVASDEASYISGAELAVDGGWSAGTYYPGLPGTPAALLP